VRLSEPERFWSKVEKSDEIDACWNWTASTFDGGYGQFRVGGRAGKNLIATRWLWVSMFGPIPNGLWVLHKCDNPRCCNPKHLFLGTHLDNIRDRDAKGRQVQGDAHWARRTPSKLARGDRHYSRTRPHLVASGDRHGTHRHPESVAYQQGEAHGSSTLTAHDIVTIRQLRADGKLLRDLAQQFGVSEGHISGITHRKYWAHIQ